MSNESPSPVRRPRRARLMALVVGALAVVALVPAGASAAQKLKVHETVTFDYQSNGNNTGVATAALHTSKRPCMKDREIHIQFGNADEEMWDYLYDGFADDATASISVDVDGDHLQYDYIASVAKKKVVKPSGKVLVCSGGASDVQYVDLD